ncbi:MAG TPA: DUF4388 domain-containing protein [Polyangia bacterium]|jgi:hypothetical protein|nr:DUF4388 domain-containing protein [Polyangia bacterium]
MSECRASLHGGLDQIGLATLLTLLDMERRSGVLLIRRRGELGRLWLRRGSVVRARVDGLTARTGKPAIYYLIGWNDGRFELTAGDVDAADEIETPTTYLLMEAARRSDEATAAAPG